MKRQELIDAIEARRQEIRQHIEELKEKDRLGTITGNEGNELDVTKDNMDFSVFDEIIELIYHGRFWTLQELLEYLQREIAIVPPESAEEGQSSGNIGIETYSRRAFARILTLDEIVWLIERRYL